jgi:hypothetical protein
MRHIRSFKNFLGMLVPQELLEDVRLLEDLMLYIENLGLAELSLEKQL